MRNQERIFNMVASSKGLKEYAKNKTKITLEKVDKAIQELFISNQKINFNSVSNLSGVSKTFLYNNAEIKKKIDGLRCKQSETVINQKSKYNKTNKSKDIVMAKEKKIKELKEENIKLKEQLEILRGKLYEII
jgi:stringent starvation protein B